MSRNTIIRATNTTAATVQAVNDATIVHQGGINWLYAYNAIGHTGKAVANAITEKYPPKRISAIADGVYNVCDKCFKSSTCNSKGCHCSVEQFRNELAHLGI